MLHRGFVATAVLMLSIGLGGCATYKNSNTVQDGPGLVFVPASLNSFAEDQGKVTDELIKLAGLKADALQPADWDTVIQAGMDYADVRCEAYMHALFRLNRDKKTVTSQLGLLGTASAGLMAAAEAAARNVAGVAIAFGLASATVDNLASNLLYDLDPSSVRTLVRSLQSAYRGAKGTGYVTRPAAISVIRGYAALCVPANIEAEVNVAVKSSTPHATPGNKAAGEPPVVSNADSAFAVKFDDATTVLQNFVFPNKVLNADARERLEAFIRMKGLEVDVATFMRGQRYAAERAEAVKALGL